MSMFLVREAAKQMSGFPSVDQYLGVLRLVPNLSCESAVIFVSVRENDPPYIGDLNTRTAQLLPENRGGLRCFGADIDQRYRIFLDQVNVDIADVKRCWNRKRNNFHRRIKRIT
jgi:hypothetical protein